MDKKNKKKSKKVKIISPIKDGILTTKVFKDPVRALEWATEIYNINTEYLRQGFKEFAKGKEYNSRISACYPYVEIVTKKTPVIDNRLSYGFLSRPGIYNTTLTRLDLYRKYYLDQFTLLLKNHKESDLRIGVSDIPIPVHFALGEDFFLEEDLSQDEIKKLPQIFDQPDLRLTDDTIPNGEYVLENDKSAAPLALFNAPRVDLSLQRLKHYTGTNAEHFQNFVIFTNYQFYVDQFIELGYELMSATDNKYVKKHRSEYTGFVEPGNYITHNKNLSSYEKATGEKVSRFPQMPAYHLKMDENLGITLVNIGIGPSNAKTITDHIAVLRPHAWLMLGHCAGLRNSQNMGDYALAHGYVRWDGVLDDAVPLEIPIPALSEIQIALEQSVSEVTGLDEYEMKKIMRTGTIASVSDRNWELWAQDLPVRKLSQSRAIALDMESATIATNGFRFRVPYGTLLCVSDKPLHGQLKLPGMADQFYREMVNQHLRIGLRTMERLRGLGHGRIHSRKLRSFHEVAFQ